MSRLLALIATLAFTLATLAVSAATVLGAPPVNITVVPDVVNVTVEQEGAPTVTVTTSVGEVMNIVTAGEQGIPGAASTVPGPPGSDGREIELQLSATHIQWRYLGVAVWLDLVPIAALTGTSGTDGREIELQASATHIQWRYSGDVAWTDLLALAAITGLPGLDGSDGIDGSNGRDMELQTSATHIQWRYIGDIVWLDLVPLSAITGSRGYDGREIELQISATHIQWRFIGAAEWINLLALADIAGTDGLAGKTVLSGSGAPAVELGTDGDYYLDMPQAHLYGPKAAGVWPAYVDLVGPAGPPGPSASVTQSAVISALDDPTDAAVVYLQQGATEAATAAKFAVGDKDGNYKQWIDSNGTVVRQCIAADTAPAVKMLSPSGVVLYSVACDGTMTFKGTMVIQ